MAKGGARARSGPAPDPDALRRDRKDDAAWLTLPLAGRPGSPPDWPLEQVTDRELAVWEREWRRPQAIIWERNGQELEVAMYVRTLVTAENPKCPAALRALVVRQQETLGLSLTGLARNRWRIETKSEQAQTSRGTRRRAEPRKASSSRSRLRVVKSSGDVEG